MNWGIISTVLAIVFFITTIIATLIITIRFTKKKQPVWASKTTQIIGIGTDAPQELTLYFSEQRVNDVYRTDLLLFNKGNETIDRSDLVAPIRMEFPRSEILRQPTIKTASREGINFNVSRLENSEAGDSITFSFEYLDANDGGLIEVLHTKIEPEGISPKSNVKGAKEIKYLGEFNPYRPKHLFGKLMYRSLMLLLLPGVLTAMLIPLSIAENSLIVSSVVLGVIWTGSIVSYRADIRPLLNYRKFPRWSAVPK